MDLNSETICALIDRKADNAEDGLLEIGTASEETKGRLSGRFNEDSIWPFRV